MKQKTFLELNQDELVTLYSVSRNEPWSRYINDPSLKFLIDNGVVRTTIQDISNVNDGLVDYYFCELTFSGLMYMFLFDKEII